MINEMVIDFVTENYRAWFTKLLLFIQCLQMEGKEQYEKQFIHDAQKLFKLHLSSFKVNI